MTQITDHLSDIRRRVTQALLRAGRKESDAFVVAVAKRHSADAIAEIFDAGHRHIGESFVNEALSKQEELRGKDIVWHFIGHIQSNKTRSIATSFDWVHSIDRLKVAQRLDAQRPAAQPALNVLIQVNQALEPQKSGIPEDRVERLAGQIAELQRLKLRGLMMIPPAASSMQDRRTYFARLRDLQDRLRGTGLPLDTLSMGMSDDFELALEQGSTCVRIGSAIFGPREDSVSARTHT